MQRRPPAHVDIECKPLVDARRFNNAQECNAANTSINHHNVNIAQD
jgi:hypothetical protein